MPSSDQPEPRDQSIPVHRGDLLDALTQQCGSEADKVALRRLARLLALIYHYEFFGEIERLRDAYRDLDPERAARPITPAERERAYLEFRDSLIAILREANFIEISHAEIAQAHSERAELPVEVRASLDEFREVRFFRRGSRHETLATTEWWGLRTRTFEAEVYDEVVVFVATRPDLPAAESRLRRRMSRRRLRGGSVLLKSFRNIASADLNALFPDIRVVMSLRDRLILTIPAIAGGVPIILNLASTVTVLFLVAGFYLGLVGAVRDEEMKTALAALSGLVALGGFIVRQWASYQRRTLLYQKQLSDNIYFRNINNNSGLFDTLIGEAEEQECKEALLACAFLLTAREPLTENALNRRIEGWLAERFGLNRGFEIADALAKLDRLGLLRRDGEALSILPLPDILNRLERTWVGLPG